MSWNSTGLETGAFHGKLCGQKKLTGRYDYLYGLPLFYTKRCFKSSCFLCTKKRRWDEKALGVKQWQAVCAIVPTIQYFMTHAARHCFTPNAVLSRCLLCCVILYDSKAPMSRVAPLWKSSHVTVKIWELLLYVLNKSVPYDLLSTSPGLPLANKTPWHSCQWNRDQESAWEKATTKTPH